MGNQARPARPGTTNLAPSALTDGGGHIVAKLGHQHRATESGLADICLVVLPILPDERPVVGTVLRDIDTIAVSLLRGARLHRLVGTASAKNKLYFAFRELGRVVRTLFLLKYLNEPELRRTIHAATNKSEQFNDFAQWLMFGGDGTIAENVRHEQRKVIKYNHLVANMVILYNVQWMSRKLKELQEKGHPVDAEVLKVLSPYRREHINRLGDYLLDLQRRAPPLDPTIEFLFKSAT